METKQFTNPDRNRYYGLRQGDVVIPSISEREDLRGRTSRIPE